MAYIQEKVDAYLAGNLSEQNAREWRNKELKATDWIVSVTDHPERASYLTYRTNLRNWPSTDEFPDTKPTL